MTSKLKVVEPPAVVKVMVAGPVGVLEAIMIVTLAEVPVVPS